MAEACAVEMSDCREDVMADRSRKGIMVTYIVFLRAINVGGRIVKMDVLRPEHEQKLVKQ